jgi:hypothetical protein
MGRSFFTVEQANRTLPLVRRIVDDLVRYHVRWQEMVAALDVRTAGNNAAASAPDEELQREIQRTAAEIERFLRELQEIGVQFKGFDLGLVDFPGKLDGRDVLLCWKLGEAAVEYWHVEDAGYSARRPGVGDGAAGTAATP